MRPTATVSLRGVGATQVKVAVHEALPTVEDSDFDGLDPVKAEFRIVATGIEDRFTSDVSREFRRAGLHCEVYRDHASGNKAEIVARFFGKDAEAMTKANELSASLGGPVYIVANGVERKVSWTANPPIEFEDFHGGLGHDIPLEDAKEAWGDFQLFESDALNQSEKFELWMETRAAPFLGKYSNKKQAYEELDYDETESLDEEPMIEDDDISFEGDAPVYQNRKVIVDTYNGYQCSDGSVYTDWESAFDAEQDLQGVGPEDTLSESEWKDRVESKIEEIDGYWCEVNQTFHSDLEEAIKSHMEASGYWPNVWNISDHGNAELVRLGKKASTFNIHPNQVVVLYRTRGNQTGEVVPATVKSINENGTITLEYEDFRVNASGTETKTIGVTEADIGETWEPAERFGRKKSYTDKGWDEQDQNMHKAVTELFNILETKRPDPTMSIEQMLQEPDHFDATIREVANKYGIPEDKLLSHVINMGNAAVNESLEADWAAGLRDVFSLWKKAKNSGRPWEAFAPSIVRECWIMFTSDTTIGLNGSNINGDPADYYIVFVNGEIAKVDGYTGSVEYVNSLPVALTNSNGSNKVFDLGSIKEDYGYQVAWDDIPYDIRNKIRIGIEEKSNQLGMDLAARKALRKTAGGVTLVQYTGDLMHLLYERGYAGDGVDIRALIRIDELTNDRFHMPTSPGQRNQHTDASKWLQGQGLTGWDAGDGYAYKYWKATDLASAIFELDTIAANHQMTKEYEDTDGIAEIMQMGSAYADDREAYASLKQSSFWVAQLSSKGGPDSFKVVEGDTAEAATQAAQATYPNKMVWVNPTKQFETMDKAQSECDSMDTQFAMWGKKATYPLYIDPERLYGLKVRFIPSADLSSVWDEYANLFGEPKGSRPWVKYFQMDDIEWDTWAKSQIMTLEVPDDAMSDVKMPMPNGKEQTYIADTNLLMTYDGVPLYDVFKSKSYPLGGNKFEIPELIRELRTQDTGKGFVYFVILKDGDILKYDDSTDELAFVDSAPAVGEGATDAMPTLWENLPANAKDRLTVGLSEKANQMSLSLAARRKQKTASYSDGTNAGIWWCVSGEWEGSYPTRYAVEAQDEESAIKAVKGQDNSQFGTHATLTVVGGPYDDKGACFSGNSIQSKRSYKDYRGNEFGIGDYVKSFETGWSGKVKEEDPRWANEFDGPMLKVVKTWSGVEQADDIRYYSPADVVKIDGEPTIAKKVTSLVDYELMVQRESKKQANASENIISELISKGWVDEGSDDTGGNRGTEASVSSKFGDDTYTFITYVDGMGKLDDGYSNIFYDYLENITVDRIINSCQELADWVAKNGIKKQSESKINWRAVKKSVEDAASLDYVSMALELGNIQDKVHDNPRYESEEREGTAYNWMLQMFDVVDIVNTGDKESEAFKVAWSEMMGYLNTLASRQFEGSKKRSDLVAIWGAIDLCIADLMQELGIQGDAYEVRKNFLPTSTIRNMETDLRDQDWPWTSTDPKAVLESDTFSVPQYLDAMKAAIQEYAKSKQAKKVAQEESLYTRDALIDRLYGSKQAKGGASIEAWAIDVNDLVGQRSWLDASRSVKDVMYLWEDPKYFGMLTLNAQSFVNTVRSTEGLSELSYIYTPEEAAEELNFYVDNGDATSFETVKYVVLPRMAEVEPLLSEDAMQMKQGRKLTRIVSGFANVADYHTKLPYVDYKGNVFTISYNETRLNPEKVHLEEIEEILKCTDPMSMIIEDRVLTASYPDKSSADAAAWLVDDLINGLDADPFRYVPPEDRVTFSSKQSAKLLTREIINRLPAIGSTDGQGEDAVAQVKFFNLGGAGTWYITEYDPAQRMFFGLCDLGYPELGYVSQDELEGVRNRMGLGIERDMYWDPRPLRECPNS